MISVLCIKQNFKVKCGEPAPVLTCSQKPAQLQKIDLDHGNVEINLDHLALGDNVWGNLFSADDPFGPRLGFQNLTQDRIIQKT